MFDPSPPALIPGFEAVSFSSTFSGFHCHGFGKAAVVSAWVCSEPSQPTSSTDRKATMTSFRMAAAPYSRNALADRKRRSDLQGLDRRAVPPLHVSQRSSALLLRYDDVL